MTNVDSVKLLKNNIVSELKYKLRNKANTPYELIDPNEYEETKSEAFYELPRTSNVDKYKTYDEYAIISVTLKNDALEFEGLAIDYEADEENLTFTIDEIGIGTLAAITDIVRNLELGN